MTAWSYSSLNAFETCPRRYRLTRIDKSVVEGTTEALTHGNAVHKAIEESIKGIAELPETYAKYQPMVAKVVSSPGEHHAELKFGLTKQLRPTGFFSPDVWVRGVLDFVSVRDKSAVVLDWKTGKPKPDNDQLTLFAGATFAMFPAVDTVRTGYAWLAHNKLDSEVFRRPQAEQIWGGFRKRVAVIELAAATGDYPPKPSGLCRKHCPVPFKMCEFSGTN